MSADILSLCWVCLLPRTSLHVPRHILLICCPLFGMLVSVFSSWSCNGWNLLDRLMWNAILTSSVLRRLTLYFFILFVMLLNFLRRSLTAVVSRWWSDGLSAIRITLTSFHALRNLLFMQMWSIWFSVTWSGNLQLTLLIRWWGKMLPPITSWLRQQLSQHSRSYGLILECTWLHGNQCCQLQFLHWTCP